MKQTESQIFLRKYLLVMLSTIVIVGLIALIGSTNTFTAILNILLLLTLVFFLLYYLVVALFNFFKHLFQKKDSFDWFYVLDLFLTLFVFIIFMYFYLSIIGASILQLL